MSSGIGNVRDILKGGAEFGDSLADIVEKVMVDDSVSEHVQSFSVDALAAFTLFYDSLIAAAKKTVEAATAPTSGYWVVVSGDLEVTYPVRAFPLADDAVAAFTECHSESLQSGDMVRVDHLEA